MVFKENSNNIENRYDKQDTQRVSEEKLEFKTQSERNKEAKESWINSMPIVVLDLSNAVAKELDSYVKNNFPGRKIEEIILDDIIKDYSKLENLWKRSHFLELESEINRWKNFS